MSRLQPQRRVDLPELCNSLELPLAPDNPDLTKREYLQSRIDQLQDNPELTRQVAAHFVERYPVAEQQDETVFTIEELLWKNSDYPIISKKVRREIADGLEGEELWVNAGEFLNALSRLWVLEDPANMFLRELGVGHGSNSLRRQIQKHLINNSDWSPNCFFTELGALDCSNKRFGRLIQALVGPEVRPDETSQRSFAEAVNSVLSPHSLELAETGNADGYPTYTLQATGTGAAGQPKNLIFASSVKPDLRFRDAVINDIEIVTNADKVLVYDRPIPDTGLRWRDLQDWWKEHNECGTDDEAKKNSIQSPSFISTGRITSPKATIHGLLRTLRKGCSGSTSTASRSMVALRSENHQATRSRCSPPSTDGLSAFNLAQHQNRA